MKNWIKLIVALSMTATISMAEPKKRSVFWGDGIRRHWKDAYWDWFLMDS